MSKYLARLKSEKQSPTELPKLSKPPYGSYGSIDGEQISEIQPANLSNVTPYQQRLIDESGRRFDFCEQHRWLLGGTCKQLEVIERRAPGNAAAALDACLLWQLIRTGQNIEAAVAVEIVAGITVRDALRWVANSQDVDTIRKERRLLLTVAASMSSTQH